MNFGDNELKAIYGMAVGWGTEVQPKEDPYRITVAANGGWGGNPIENSGYSMGVIQFDFGTQNPKYSTQFVSMVSQWVRDQRRAAGMTPAQIDAPVFSVTEAKMAEYLSTSKADPGKTLTWMNGTDRNLFEAWGAEPVNRASFYSTFESVVIKDNLIRINKNGFLTDSRFTALPASDQSRIFAMLAKAINQGGPKRFDTAAALLDALPANKYGANELAKAIASSGFSSALKQGISHADSVGKVLAALDSSPKLQSMFAEASGTASFDSSTVAASPGLTFFKTLMMYGKSYPDSALQLIDKINQLKGSASHYFRSHHAASSTH